MSYSGPVQTDYTELLSGFYDNDEPVVTLLEVEPEAKAESLVPPTEPEIEPQQVKLHDSAEPEQGPDAEPGKSLSTWHGSGETRNDENVGANNTGGALGNILVTTRKQSNLYHATSDTGPVDNMKGVRVLCGSRVVDL